jgi:hypothetical protein
MTSYLETYYMLMTQLLPRNIQHRIRSLQRLLLLSLFRV